MMLQPGLTIYKYTLQQRLGSGEFGEVWLCEDQTLKQSVALKIIPHPLKELAKHLEEAIIGNRTDHPNLLKIHYADVIPLDADKNVTLIAQEYLSNGSIVSKVTAGNFLIIPDWLDCMKAVLSGLEFLHHASIFHNDIKPSNILIGEQGHAVLSDYGISAMSAGQTPVSPKSAYLAHLAPEFQHTKKISVQTDIYQVGVTAYRLINGLSSVVAEFDVLELDEFNARKLGGRIPDPNGYKPWIPSSLKRIINKAINPDPAKRYQTALEMRRDLEKQHFPGYWTQQPDGQLVGHGTSYRYSYSVLRSGNLYSLSCLQLNEKTQYVNRIQRFCQKGLTRKKSESLLTEFMQWVVKSAK